MSAYQVYCYQSDALSGYNPEMLHYQDDHKLTERSSEIHLFLLWVYIHRASANAFHCVRIA